VLLFDFEKHYQQVSIKDLTSTEVCLCTTKCVSHFCTVILYFN